MSFSTIMILISIGLCAGLMSGMIGIGGGVIIVPALMFFIGLSQVEAQGTSLALMLPPIGILAVYNYQRAGALNWKFALIIAVAFVLGGYLGSKLSLNLLSEVIMKKIFGFFLLAIAVKMIFFSK